MKRRASLSAFTQLYATTTFVVASLVLACAQPPLNPIGPMPGVSRYDDVTAGLVEHHRFHHHGGITLLIAMSLDTLAVSAEQQPAVDRARSALGTAMAAARSSDQALLGTLADGATSGNIDVVKVDAELSQVGVANASVFAASALALDELRGVLTPRQRAALFEKVAWHWTVWQSANGERAADRADPATIVANLGLTTDQADRIRATVASKLREVTPLDPAEVTTSVHELDGGFQKGGFDAQTITAASLADQHMAAWGAARLVSIVEASAPVLDAEQRNLLAAGLSKHAHDTARARGVQ
jgi:Spy/CpxP family protein refolding chaperone